MRKKFYNTYFKHEDQHWWFLSRRCIIKKIIDCYFYKNNIKNKKILEVGTCSGGNLEMLSQYGNLFAMEMDKDACKIAQDRGLCDVKQGKLPDQFPFDKQFDVICMFDVLEHIEDDLATLHCLKDKLSSRGKLIITVPAYQWLWSQHDVISHHYRRYSKKTLTHVLNQAGFKINYITYFNTFLFPLIAGIRLINNCLGIKEDSDMEMPSKGVNHILKTIFASERFFLPKTSFPFGVSLLVVVDQ